MNLHMMIDKYGKRCSAFHRKPPMLKGTYYEDSDSKKLQRLLLKKEG